MKEKASKLTCPTLPFTWQCYTWRIARYALNTKNNLIKGHANIHIYFWVYQVQNFLKFCWQFLSVLYLIWPDNYTSTVTFQEILCSCLRGDAQTNWAALQLINDKNSKIKRVKILRKFMESGFSGYIYIFVLCTYYLQSLWTSVQWFKKSADCSKIIKKNNKKMMTYRMIDCHTGQKHYTPVTCCVGYDNVFSPDIVAWGMIKISGEKTLTLQFDILFT